MEKVYWRKTYFSFTLQCFRWFWLALHLLLLDKTIMAPSNGKGIQFVFSELQLIVYAAMVLIKKTLINDVKTFQMHEKNGD